MRPQDSGAVLGPGIHGVIASGRTRSSWPPAMPMLLLLGLGQEWGKGVYQALWMGSSSSREQGRFLGLEEGFQGYLQVIGVGCCHLSHLPFFVAA